MATTLLTCPHCQATLSIAQAIPAGATLRCLACNTMFAVAAPPAAPPVAPAAPAKTPARPAAPARASSKDPQHTAPRPAARPKAPTLAPAPTGGAPWRILGGLALAAVALLFLGGLAALLWTNVFAERPTSGTDVPAQPLAQGATVQPSEMPAVKPSGDAPTAKDPAQDAPPKQAKDPDDVDLADVVKKKPMPPSPPPEPAPAPKDKPAPVPEPAPEPKLPPKAEPEPKPLPKPEPEPKQPPAPVVPAESAATPIAPGVTREAIDAAVASGVKYLKAQQLPSGSWQGAVGEGHSAGYTAMGGLALLESNVPADDPAVRRAAQFVRKSVPELHRTYEISAAILFLDRLGDKEDHELIRSLALRLLAAQKGSGGWQYESPTISAEQAQQLDSHLRVHWPWSPMRPKPAAKGDKSAVPAFDLTKLTPQYVRWNNAHQADFGIFGDNSNTQFALLALWAARRHGLASECPLLLSYLRFLTTQHADGGWSYMYIGRPPGMPGQGPPGFGPPQGGPPQGPPGFRPPQGPPGFGPGGFGGPGGPKQPPQGGSGNKGSGGAMASKPTMTCVGLLGLAMGHGVAAEGAKAAKGPAKNKLQQPAIQRGLALLAASIEDPVADGAAKPSMQNLYLLWSVERVGVLYDLKTIGGKDWYAWGAQILLANQQPAGNWSNGQYQGSTDALDTSFALLFLKRSNPVADLTDNLRLHMLIRDPHAK